MTMSYVVLIAVILTTLCITMLPSEDNFIRRRAQDTNPGIDPTEPLDVIPPPPGHHVARDNEHPPPPRTPAKSHGKDDDEDKKDVYIPNTPTKQPSMNSQDAIARNSKLMRMAPKMTIVPTPKELAVRYPDSVTRSYEFYRLDERIDQFFNDTIPAANKYYFSIAAMFKNEAGAMKEWLDHHIAHGVDHFYLVNDARPDDKDDGVDKILAPYIEKGIVSMHKTEKYDTPFRQAALYKKLILNIVAHNESHWISIIDLDEFMYSPVNVNIQDVLREHEDLAMIGVNWAWFGSNGHLDQPKSITQSFTKRAALNYTKHPDLVKHYGVLTRRYQKYIINTRMRLETVDIHEAHVEGTVASLSLSSDPDNPLLVVNHYSVQSKSFFLKNKGLRGDVNNWVPTDARNEAWFDICNINEVEDTRLSDQNKMLNIPAI